MPHAPCREAQLLLLCAITYRSARAEIAAPRFNRQNTGPRLEQVRLYTIRRLAASFKKAG